MIIREDLIEAHRQAWEHISRPGSWWTGAQRVELAETVIEAVTDGEPLPPWVGFAAAGRLRPEPVAPSMAHDMAYRIARHAGTITRDLYDAAAAELGALPYVELCSIVSTVASIAHFCRNIGVEIPAFPAPVDGLPTGEQPAELAQPTLNWVPVAAPADQVAAVLQAYSAVPAELANTQRLAAAMYMPDEEMQHADWTRRAGGLTRPQMELIAARVAQLRECFY